jgi:hypothetical protein
METEALKLKVKVKSLLADFLGVEADDIKDEYSLTNDLHMTPADISDFLQILEENGIETAKINLAEIDTFDELIEYLVS